MVLVLDGMIAMCRFGSIQCAHTANAPTHTRTLFVSVHWNGFASRGTFHTNFVTQLALPECSFMPAAAGFTAD